MALPATTVWEVRTTGNDANGGGFSSARSGTDYSQQDAAQLSLTDLACASNTTLTSATGGFTAAMVGNIIQIASGTNAAAGFYEVTAYTSTNQVTIDRTCASGGNMTDGVGKLGGALATPRPAFNVMADENRVWVKAGTYTVSNADTRWLIPKDGQVHGYTTTRGDLGQATIDCTTTSINIVEFTGSAVISFANFIIDGNDNASTVGVYSDWGSAAAPGSVLLNLDIRDCGTGVSVSSGHLLSAIKCKASGCATVGFRYCNAQLCRATDNGIGFSYCRTEYCISDANASYGYHKSADDSLAHLNSVAYGNGGSGFYDSDSATFSATYVNCIAVRNTGYGFHDGWSRSSIMCLGCVTYGNSSGGYNSARLAPTAISGDPFVNAAAGDFRPNPATEAGRAIMGAGIGPVGQTSYPDIGAVQRGDNTVPAVGDVESGVTFGDGAALTGTFAVPAEEDVRDGVTYGAGGTEFEGTLAGGGGGVDLPDVMTIGA